MYDIVFTEYAIEGIKKLKNLGNKIYLDELEEQLDRIKYYGESAGLALENKFGYNLKGYYKIYFADKSWRIVFTEIDKDFNLIEITIVENRETVYKMADEIINS